MTQKILFGGYTRRIGKGIYQATLDEQDNKITAVKPYIELENPSYLTISKQNILYTVVKVADKGGLAAYNLNGDQPQLINRTMADGAPPAYVAIDEARQLVYAANYHKGQINIHQIQADGGLKLVNTVTHQGSSIKPEQKSAHVHYTDLTPDGQLIVCDLGTDEVTLYAVDEMGNTKLSSTFKTPAGFGPRHLVFHPNQKTVYLLGELASQIIVLDYDSHTSQLTPQQTLSMLPDDCTVKSAGAAIRISQDGHYLYASNRGYNSLVVYQIDSGNQQLKVIQQISTAGDFPRDFNFDQTEALIIVGNQNSDNATLYRRDFETGLLTLIQKEIDAPECVCVYPQA